MFILFTKEKNKFGYQGYVGAEYNPLTNTDDGLSWMKEINREDK